MSLRLALAGACIFWAMCFVGLYPARSQTANWTVWGCLMAAIFFGVAWLYHARMRIAVDDAGIRARGLRRTLRVGYADILRVNVQTALVIRLYLVVTRKGQILFSSHLAGHRQLCALLIERSGMVRCTP